MDSHSVTQLNVNIVTTVNVLYNGDNGFGSAVGVINYVHWSNNVKRLQRFCPAPRGNAT